MALPKLKSPIFTIELPSTKLKVDFRPFLVSEEKVLLIAQESQEPETITKAVKQVLQNCILDDTVSVDKLSTFDIEFFFLQLRARSVNNVIKLRLTDPEDENKHYEVEIDVNDVNVYFPEGHDSKISLTDELGVKMMYPDYGLLLKYANAEDVTENLFNVIADCIEYVYDQEEIYPFKDETEQERRAFLDSLPVDCFAKLRQFFDTMPRLQHTIKVTRDDKTTFEVTLQGLTDFFTFA